MGDQALSSATNFIATVVVARSVRADEFGAFATGMVIFYLVLAVQRALVSTPLTIRVSARSEQAGEVAACVAAAVITGAVAGVLLAGVGVVVGGHLGGVLCVIGVLMPGLCTQDTWRFVFFTVGRPAAALANDLLWAVVLVGGLAVAARGDPSLALLAAIWAAAACIAAVAGGYQSRVKPAWRDGGRYVRRHGDLGWRYAVESVITNGSWVVATLALGAAVGTAAVGSLRGAQTLFGPWTTLQAGVGMAAVPEGARLLTRRPAALRPVLLVVSGGLAASALGWGAVLLVLPGRWGEALLGETWPGARDLLPAVIVMMIGQGMFTGGFVGLRVLAAARETLRLRVAAVTVSFGAALVGGLTGGVTGGAWGIALGPWVNGVGSWLYFARLIKRCGVSRRSDLRSDRTSEDGGRG